MPTIDVNKLNGKIVENGMTKESLAALLGIDRSTFFRRIKNNRLLLADVHCICSALHLTNDEAVSIFLSRKSQN